MNALFFVFAVVSVSVGISLIVLASVWAAGLNADVISFATLSGVVTPLTAYGFKKHECQ